VPGARASTEKIGFVCITAYTTRFTVRLCVIVELSCISNTPRRKSWKIIRWKAWGGTPGWNYMEGKGGQRRGWRGGKGRDRKVGRCEIEGRATK